MFVNHILQVPNFYFFLLILRQEMRNRVNTPSNSVSILDALYQYVCVSLSTHPPDCNAKLPREKEAFTSALPGSQFIGFLCCTVLLKVYQNEVYANTRVKCFF